MRICMVNIFDINFGFIYKVPIAHEKKKQILLNIKWKISDFEICNFQEVQISNVWQIY